MNPFNVFQELTNEEKVISEEIIELMELAGFKKIYVNRFSRLRRPEQPYMINFIGGNCMYETTFNSIQKVLKYARHQVVCQYNHKMIAALDNA